MGRKKTKKQKVQMTVAAVPKKVAEVDEIIELPSGKAIVATTSYRALAEKQIDNLFQDLLANLSDVMPKGRKKKERKSQKKARLLRILNALREGKDTLKTFEFTHQHGFSDGHSASIYALFFKGDQIVSDPELVFEGSLSKTAELGKGVYCKIRKDLNIFDGAFLVAEVDMKESINPKARGRLSKLLIEKKFYGIKSIFNTEDGEFTHGTSCIITLNSENEFSKKLDFSISNPTTWMRVRKHFDSFDALISNNLQKSECVTFGIPFISFELSDENNEKDWEIVEEKFNRLKLFHLEENEEGCRYFIEILNDGSQQKTFPFLPRRCPISLKEFPSVEEHIQYLNENFSFHFRSLPDGNISIEMNPIHKPFKPIQVFSGQPLPKILWPFHHEEEPVILQPGKNSGWVRTKTQNEWKEAMLQDDPEFPNEAIDLCISINTHLNRDEFKYTNENPGSVRLGYLNFFENNFEKIVADDNVLVVLGISVYLMKHGIFSPSDYAKVFDTFLEDRVVRQERAANSQTSLQKSSETPKSPQEEAPTPSQKSPMKESLLRRRSPKQA